MEGAGHQQQPSAQCVKEEPGNDQAQHCLGKPNDSRPAPARRLRSVYPFQAGGAQDTIFMFDDALPAIETMAFRAACHSFAAGVVKAPLFRNA
jgi:hypothetical protein